MKPVVVEHTLEGVAVAVFVGLFAVVTVVGLVAVAWRRMHPATTMDAWAAADRTLGPVVTWFFLGGSIFTAYTYMSVPEHVFKDGGAGFFALAYTIIVFPLLFAVLPRLASVCRRRYYLTAGEFVRARYGSRPLALAVAVTGILATMPYIALQLIGIEAVLDALGVGGNDVPLYIAFALIAAYTYHSGVRAPALIAVVKDVLIFVAFATIVVVAVRNVGGLGAVFGAAETALPKKEPPGALVPTGAADQLEFATLALGSALALVLYPHVITVALSANKPDYIRRAAVTLPLFSLLLGLAALVGLIALKAGIDPERGDFVVPDLVLHMFDPAFSGFALAAIAIGALMPAAVMSIGVANLFTRDVYKQYLRPDASDAQEAQMARLISLAVKAGALVFLVTLPRSYTIELQLLGGVWIIQTLPAVVIGLYTTWLHSRGLLAGWAVGMLAGTVMAIQGEGGGIFAVRAFGVELPAFEALYALALNLAVAIAVTAVIRRRGGPKDRDETCPEDYLD